jgi:DNA-binding FrmR family transcriptional regulator
MKRDMIVAALPRANSKPASKPAPKSGESLADMAWRLNRLEGQLQKLSELVREHAEDVDRLVRIVAEDRDVIRRQLLRKHHEKVRVRKHLRESNSRVGLDS